MLLNVKIKKILIKKFFILLYNMYGIMAYIRCQNYILLLNIEFCDIDITFYDMHGLFGYLTSHYAIFISYYAT